MPYALCTRVYIIYYSKEYVPRIIILYFLGHYVNYNGTHNFIQYQKKFNRLAFRVIFRSNRCQRTVVCIIIIFQDRKKIFCSTRLLGYFLDDTNA